MFSTIFWGVVQIAILAFFLGLIANILRVWATYILDKVKDKVTPNGAEQQEEITAVTEGAAPS